MSKDGNGRVGGTGTGHYMAFVPFVPLPTLRQTVQTGQMYRLYRLYRRRARQTMEREANMTDDTATRLAALDLMLCALDPDHPRAGFTDAVTRLLEPIYGEDGRTYVDQRQLRRILAAAVDELRTLFPEQDAETERAIDEAFEEIAVAVDGLTAPKAQH